MKPKNAGMPLSTIDEEEDDQVSEQRMIAAGNLIARIDRVFQNFRQVIDTDNSISPCVRDTLHALLDKDLVLWREREFAATLRTRRRNGDEHL
ncbi:hypothetical protein [Bradyrhizobium neotropicale]|uniref:hypothetical protein n=1 Tax=Bradyrhizobium neotropicale TaxID=1497615 RepID=UPI001AD62CB4|nr:hypothetical protein [Bradyrhizobium neotropicale]MBO4227664.1 hypothetical protein [Bradyrhizobium neotropicale]